MFPCNNSNIPNSWTELSALCSERRIVHTDSPAALYKDKGEKALLPLYLDRLYWAACLCLSIPSSCALQLKIPLHEEGQLSSPSGKKEPEKDLCENNSGITQKWSVMRGRLLQREFFVSSGYVIPRLNNPLTWRKFRRRFTLFIHAKQTSSPLSHKSAGASFPSLPTSQ